MPDVNQVYQSQYMRAQQLGGQARRVTIEGATAEVLGSGERAVQKVVLKFAKVAPRLPLNPTNARLLAATWGPDTANWIGHVIELTTRKVMFNGALVDSIVVQIPAPAAAAAPAAAPFPEAAGDPSDIQW
jgi:hypothetical protein